jgi:hypothetical protein
MRLRPTIAISPIGAKEEPAGVNETHTHRAMPARTLSGLCWDQTWDPPPIVRERGAFPDRVRSTFRRREDGRDS